MMHTRLVVRPARRRLARRCVVWLAVLSMLVPAVPALAFKPYTHVATGQTVLEDVLDDGAVTIDGRAYPVPDRVRQALEQFPEYFNAGVVGPDGFPDLTFGQSVIHPEQTGKWLRHLLDRAWALGGEGQLKALAFSHGVLFHTIGDLWAHTLVNELSEGIFPGVGEIVTDLDKMKIALRHTIVEGYIGDATPGYDGNPAAGPVDSDGDGTADDTSNIATAGIDFGAPIDFIYHTLVDPDQPLPVGTCDDGIDDDEDGTADDGCPGGSYTVGDPEPVRGPLIDYFLDLQSDLEIARAEYAADERHTDCTLLDPDCEERDQEVYAATSRGFRRSTETLRVCVGATIGCVASGTDVADDLLLNDLFIDYLDAWIDDIETGLQHWPELGLAISRALFDPQTRRDIQNHLCRNEGPEDGELRRDCEDSLGAVDYVTEATSGFQTNYLYAMLGAPDFVGSFAETLSDFSDAVSDAIGTTFNPLSMAMKEVKDYAKAQIIGMLEERFGVDADELQTLLHHPGKILVEGSINVTVDGEQQSVPVFDDQAHARLDEVLGLPEDHHEGASQGHRLKDGAAFDPATMPLFQNTVTMGKLALLGGDGLDQVLTDMVGSDVTYYSRFDRPNVMTVGTDHEIVVDQPPLVPGAADPVVLGPDNAVRIDGRGATNGDDRLGPVAAAGDVNGDGHEDLVIGTPNRDDYDDHGRRGAAYVVFGPVDDDAAITDLNQPGGPRGFLIKGSEIDLSYLGRLGFIGREVDGLGDVNGDGLDDVVVTTATGQTKGAAFIVYGKDDTADVDLKDLMCFEDCPYGWVVPAPEDAPGIRLDGEIRTDSPVQDAVSPVGDVNGDGLPDLGIMMQDGTAVLYVTPDRPVIDLDALFVRDENDAITDAAGGLVIPDGRGAAVTGVGDMNEDGLGDIALTAANDFDDVPDGPYVVLGAADTTGRLVELRCVSLGCEKQLPDDGDPSTDESELTTSYSSQGWFIDTSEYWGYSDDDPFLIHENDDYIYTTYDRNAYPAFGSGEANVGQHIAGVGDMTGDGIPDLAVVAESNEDGETSYDFGNPGVVYVVPGSRGATGVNRFDDTQLVRVLGVEGIRGDAEIQTVSPAGDVDGDGLDDLAVTIYDGVDATSEQETQQDVRRYVAVVFGKDVAAQEEDGREALDVRLDQAVDTPSADAYIIEGPALDGTWHEPSSLLAEEHAPTILAALGDVDGDGRDDLAIGNPVASSAGAPDGGTVVIHISAGRPLVPAYEVQPRTVHEPWLTSIDSDHAWRADGQPIFQRPGGGAGTFPLWESCVLRDAVFRELFVDWESTSGGFPDFGDEPSVLLAGLTDAQACGLDGDGIDAAVDGHVDDAGSFIDESDVDSGRFTDQHLDGTTHGVIVDDGGLHVAANDHVDGILVTTSGTGGPARLELCREPVWTLELQAGDAGIGTCGSLTWTSTAGGATVQLDGWTVTVPAGGTVTLTQTDDGPSLHVPATSSAPATVTGPDGVAHEVAAGTTFLVADAGTPDPGDGTEDPDEGTEDPDDEPGDESGGEPGTDTNRRDEVAVACETAGDAFTDDDGAVHENSIDCLAALGVLHGWEDGTVRPGGEVVRGQTAAMLMRLLTAVEGQSAGDLCPTDVEAFPDVAGVFADAIGCLESAGVLAGFPDGNYRPGWPTTRGQLATLLRGILADLGRPVADVDELAFSDLTDGGPHAGDVSALAAIDVVLGRSDGTYRPGDTVTRGEMASATRRLIQHVAGT